jgi:phosphoribosylformylglycinamidine synthase
VPSGFAAPGHALLLLSPAHTTTIEERLAEFGSSEYAKTILGELWGTPPSLDLATEAALHKALAALADAKLVHSARDISDGGIAVALAEGCFEHGVGARVNLLEGPDLPLALRLFHESASQVLLSCDENQVADIRTLLADYPELIVEDIGETVADTLEIRVNSKPLVNEPLHGLEHRWANALEAMLTEVTA